MGGRPRVSCGTQKLRDHMAYSFRIQLMKGCVSRRRGAGFGQVVSPEKSQRGLVGSVAHQLSPPIPDKDFVV